MRITTRLKLTVWIMNPEGCDVVQGFKDSAGRVAAQSLFLSVDDTMVENEGEKFEFCSRLFDHAAYNGSNYLNGRCMVSILLSFPVLSDGFIRYLSVPFGYWLCDKKRTKLEIAATMVCRVMDNIGLDRQVFLLCES